MVFFLDFSLFHEKLNSEGISGVKNEEPGALIGRNVHCRHVLTILERFSSFAETAIFASCADLPKSEPPWAVANFMIEKG